MAGPEGRRKQPEMTAATHANRRPALALSSRQARIAFTSSRDFGSINARIGFGILVRCSLRQASLGSSKLFDGALLNLTCHWE
jgi:hypothetical protein